MAARLVAVNGAHDRGGGLMEGTVDKLNWKSIPS